MTNKEHILVSSRDIFATCAPEARTIRVNEIFLPHYIRKNRVPSFDRELRSLVVAEYDVRRKHGKRQMDGWTDG